MTALRTATRRLCRTALVAGAVLAPAAAFAQPYQATYDGPATGARAFGYTVGAQNARLFDTPAAPGQSLAILEYCVDYQNSVTEGETYRANLTNLGAVVNGAATLSLTRHPAGLQGYEQAAFLIDQFATNGQENWGGIQGAIWGLFGAPGAPSTGTAGTTDRTTTAYWAGLAGAFVANGAAVSAYDFSRFTLITDVRAAGAADDDYAQEFMTPTTVTPEPGSLALLAVGLGGTIVAASRRRRATEVAL